MRGFLVPRPRAAAEAAAEPVAAEDAQVKIADTSAGGEADKVIQLNLCVDNDGCKFGCMCRGSRLFDQLKAELQLAKSGKYVPDVQPAASDLTAAFPFCTWRSLRWGMSGPTPCCKAQFSCKAQFRAWPSLCGWCTHSRMFPYKCPLPVFAPSFPFCTWRSLRWDMSGVTPSGPFSWRRLSCPQLLLQTHQGCLSCWPCKAHACALGELRYRKKPRVCMRPLSKTLPRRPRPSARQSPAIPAMAPKFLIPTLEPLNYFLGESMKAFLCVYFSPMQYHAAPCSLMRVHAPIAAPYSPMQWHAASCMASSMHGLSRPRPLPAPASSPNQCSLPA
eukprot:329107-Chlamydomonas_euryale.AAC.17